MKQSPEQNHAALPSAREDAERAADIRLTPQTQSAAYRLAYTDVDFLLRDEARPVRLQLELLKPELELQDQRIESTIVVFGSARIPDPDSAATQLAAAQAARASHPGDPACEAAVLRCQRAHERARYYEEARRFARLVSAQEQNEHSRCFVIVTGGGPGIMEAANRGAADVDALSIGLSITLPHEQAPNAFITPELSFQFHYFALRKMHFLMRAKALVVFPGGFGTFDELFETLCLIQTKKIRPMPVMLFGRTFWERVVDFEAMVEEGVISRSDLELFVYVETAAEAWERICAYYEQQAPGC
ncbi:TIGR00730 family Rossman fold protein [Thiocapsa imhoffii]|uniref:AMP nucleosidase n=1 Tax=Thiocapsa imhoffii TaxID=382777 RepID=A0A9X0WJ38_9GAMM|nr:TIGR00730 family Rossman fold protein [Thiocapsa imhoffii]MBK1645518.1 TIGR00730 family Rossman fold protein [Thiocapsa imhoffii]